MAQKAWRATTRIEWGSGDGTKKVFGLGDVVTGPSNEEMAQLWEAGALEETVVADSESDTAESTSDGDVPAGGVDTSSPDVSVVKSDTGAPVARAGTPTNAPTMGAES